MMLSSMGTPSSVLIQETPSYGVLLVFYSLLKSRVEGKATNTTLILTASGV
jgi:hypothetical protein